MSAAPVRLDDEARTSIAQRNHLLAALPAAELQRWLPHLEYVDLPLGKALHESRGVLSHVYFPVTAIVSLIYVTENGESTEVGIIGNEGVVGMSLFMGGDFMPSRAVVQGSGQCLRLRSRVFLEEIRNASVLRLLLLYTQTLIAQMSLTAACNRHHSIDQKLCRRLLLSLDRSPGNRFEMTQEMLSNILGVRREGVTVNALKLQQANLIQYARGQITVLDRAGLERRACECYAVVEKERARLRPSAVGLPETADTGG